MEAPRRHDAFASARVRYTCAVEPTVMNTGPCAKRKSGEAASPVIVRSSSPSPPQRRLREPLVLRPCLLDEARAQIASLEHDRLRRPLAALRERAARVALGSARPPRSREQQPRSLRRTRASIPTVLPVVRGAARRPRSARYRGSQARFGRSQRSTTDSSSPLRPRSPRPGRGRCVRRRSSGRMGAQ